MQNMQKQTHLDPSIGVTAPTNALRKEHQQCANESPLCLLSVLTRTSRYVPATLGVPNLSATPPALRNEAMAVQKLSPPGPPSGHKHSWDDMGGKGMRIARLSGTRAPLAPLAMQGKSSTTIIAPTNIPHPHRGKTRQSTAARQRETADANAQHHPLPPPSSSRTSFETIPDPPSHPPAPPRSSPAPTLTWVCLPPIVLVSVVSCCGAIYLDTLPSTDLQPYARP
ncbi:hypothetical protein PMIN06_012603 [Paraphaeosphaeria minitans]